MIQFPVKTNEVSVIENKTYSRFTLNFKKVLVIFINEVIWLVASGCNFISFLNVLIVGSIHNMFSKLSP